MALQVFKDWFCWCCLDEQDTYDIYDENDERTRLVPDDLEALRSHGTGDSALVDKQQQLQERLGTIVRAKEGQMVNVCSRIPFNLHNQTVLPNLWPTPDPDLSLSRSTSQSDLVQTLTLIHSHDRVPYHPLHPGNPYPRVVSQSRSSSSRAESPEREIAATIATLSRPHPILNVRLVGFEDQRGRTREREHDRDRDRDHLVGSDSTVTQSQIPTITSHNFDTPPPPDDFKLQDLGAISRSWDD